MEKIILEGYVLEYIGEMEFVKIEDKLFVFNPRDRYNNKKNLGLNKYGKNDFCKFKINKGFNKKSGVYALYTDGDLVYIGQASDMGKRWGGNGYGSISPKNCFIEC